MALVAAIPGILNVVAKDQVSTAEGVVVLVALTIRDVFRRAS